MSDDKALRRSNLIAIRRALDHHNSNCPVPARAILLNPADHERLDIASLWGLPVEADDRVPHKRCRIVCDGSAWGLEDELLEYLQEPGERLAGNALQ